MTQPPPDAATLARPFWQTKRQISHEEARQIAHRFIAKHFGNADQEYPHVSIPANTERDDDLLLLSYINQSEAALRSAEARVKELEETTFQRRIGDWMVQTFSDEVCKDTLERAMRFLEEATELCQSLGMTADQATTVTRYVFGRPVGETSQEVGGAIVTLAALCWSLGIDMVALGETELARIDTPEMRAKIAAKQVTKRLFGMSSNSTLPTPEPTDD